jgi:hypothetical protein
MIKSSEGEKEVGKEQNNGLVNGSVRAELAVVVGAGCYCGQLPSPLCVFPSHGT